MKLGNLICNDIDLGSIEGKDLSCRLLLFGGKKEDKARSIL